VNEDSGKRRPDGSMLGDDPVATAAGLTAALTAMTSQLTEVKKTVRRGKWVVAGIIAGLILDVALTVIVSVTAVEASNAGNRANQTVAQLHTTQLTSCRAGNQTRAQEVQLWMHLAAVSASPKTTPAQRASVGKLLAYIRATFAPRNCGVLYHLKGAADGEHGR
jgi:hypothetical protein